MQSRLKSAQCGVFALLLVGGLSGCRHKEPPPAPPAASAPPPPAATAPAPITVITPLPSVPAVAGPNVQPAAPELPAPKPAPVKQSRRHRRSRPSPFPADVAAAKQAAAAPTAEAPATQAASASASAATAVEAAPALGQLSTGTAIGSGERNRLISEIHILETRLGKIKAPATKDALAVQMQVKTFLTRAREAVAENDLDGAHTLDTKALVLLDELQSE